MTFPNWLLAIPAKLRNAAVLALAGALVGFGVGYRVFAPRKVAEVYKPAQRQKDGSLVIERKPDPTAKPTAIVPKGGTVERVVRIRVQPGAPVPVTPEPVAPVVPRGTIEPIPAAVPASRSDSLVCPPVDVELTLVRMRDQSRRVVASAKGGTIIGGVDIPVESAVVPRSLRWSAGVFGDPVARTVGGWLARDVGPFRAIGTVLPDPGGKGIRTGLGIGVRF